MTPLTEPSLELSPDPLSQYRKENPVGSPVVEALDENHHSRASGDSMNQVETSACQTERSVDPAPYPTASPALGRGLPGSRLLATAVKCVSRGQTSAGANSSVITHTCPTCFRLSRKIFQEAWTCLNPQCEAIWKIPISGLLRTVPDDFKLTYSESYIRPIDAPGPIAIPYDIKPPSAFEQYSGVWSAYLTGGELAEERTTCPGLTSRLGLPGVRPRELAVGVERFGESRTVLAKLTNSDARGARKRSAWRNNSRRSPCLNSGGMT